MQFFDSLFTEFGSWLYDWIEPYIEWFYILGVIIATVIAFMVLRRVIKALAFNVQFLVSAPIVVVGLTIFFSSVTFLIWIYNQFQLLKNYIEVGDSSCTFKVFMYFLDAVGLYQPLQLGLNLLLYIFSSFLMFKLYEIYRKVLRWISDELFKLGVLGSI
jgi:hypothetical protein